jgi:hypothetical protein
MIIYKPVSKKPRAVHKVLVNLPKHNGPKIIFGEGCRLGEARLRREQIIFKQLPYEIKVS